jgi:hypothetical protein
MITASMSTNASEKLTNNLPIDHDHTEQPPKPYWPVEKAKAATMSMIYSAIVGYAQPQVHGPQL